MPKTPAERQKKRYDKKKSGGWLRLWIPPHLILRVKQLIKGDEK